MEKKTKRKSDKEYPKWPWVDYQFQDLKFFQDVGQLHIAKGLNPKTNIIDEHLTTTNITKLFGKVNKFKTTNPMLPLEKKERLERLYWSFYEIGHITNNEIMAWLVKGWIT